MVALDGTLSKDPDSSPGTNDDIVLFQWYEDYGLVSELFLGAGDLLNVQLAVGVHTITLKVTDSQGLTDASTVQFPVVDTTNPLTLGHGLAQSPVPGRPCHADRYRQPKLERCLHR